MLCGIASDTTVYCAGLLVASYWHATVTNITVWCVVTPYNYLAVYNTTVCCLLVPSVVVVISRQPLLWPNCNTIRFATFSTIYSAVQGIELYEILLQTV